MESSETPKMSKPERLRKLYALSDSIVESALGKDKQTKRKLYRLRDKVLEEIRQLESEREEARQRYYSKVREKMKEVGFVPSSEKD